MGIRVYCTISRWICLVTFLPVFSQLFPSSFAFEDLFLNEPFNDNDDGASSLFLDADDFTDGNGRVSYSTEQPQFFDVGVNVDVDHNALTTSDPLTQLTDTSSDACMDFSSPPSTSSSSLFKKLRARANSCEDPDVDAGNGETEREKAITAEQIKKYWDDHRRTRRLLDFILPWLLHLGALIPYEEARQESGLLPLFSGLGLESKHTEKLMREISRETLSFIILESRYWDDAKRSPAAVSFLKTAVQARHLETVKSLLEHGVSVHQRVDQVPSMEFAESMTSDDAKSKEIMIILLSHASAEEMKGKNEIPID